ncbi:AAA family ATPase [Salipaludibacillus sp. CF4.18]|uniref:AAA family ATPase n=1 Tax=Salipaludibacillus sp. CF4.18 TaxID=3373081 RepID=UPI003EE738AB
MEMADIQSLAIRIKKNVQTVIIGKEMVIDQLVIALLSSSHVLLDDVPGMGKTILANSLSQSISGKFKRIQFTPDLLPSDVTGIHFFNQKQGEFEFREGPIFTNILLADEINRATPRTQSSLLECMEERQVSIDGETHSLTKPFMVIATQNPVESQGTFPLPEAQLDRFLMKIEMGYPSKEEGIAILKRFKQGNPLEGIKAVASQEEIRAAQDLYSSVHVSDDLLDYIIQIVEATRNHEEIELGVSPRGSQALLKAVQVHAILQGRSFVLPDDIKALIKPVLAHRLVIDQMSQLKQGYEHELLDEIIKHIPVPSEEELLKGVK